jgi:hypothetical protein
LIYNRYMRNPFAVTVLSLDSFGQKGHVSQAVSAFSEEVK